MIINLLYVNHYVES